MIVIDDPSVAAYIEQRLNVTLHQPYKAWGFATNGGRALAAVVFNGFNRANVDLTVIAEPGGANRAVLLWLANHVFNELGCRRLTARIKKRNKRALRMAARCGFVFEHVAKGYYVDDDAVVYRMLRAECRWLQKIGGDNRLSRAA